MNQKQASKRKMVVPVDGSEPAMHALRVALDRALDTGVPVMPVK